MNSNDVSPQRDEAMQQSVNEMASCAKSASSWLAVADSKTKNAALTAMADALTRSAPAILTANCRDISAAESAGITGAFLKRLVVTEGKLGSMAKGLVDVAGLPDPVGRVMESFTRPNGLNIRKISVPFGIVGIIYESRPDVTSDAAALCFKSGNAVILRGGSESRETNLSIVAALRQGLRASGAPEDCVQYVQDPSRAAVTDMLKARGLIDLLIPRGGAGLIKTVVEDASVPVIETGTGNCHIYVHREADLGLAESVIVNAKCSYPAVCNAVETVLVDRNVAPVLLPGLIGALRARGVEVRGCDEARALVLDVAAATESDWQTEYLDLVLAVRVVDGFDQAISHIGRYGTKHSEAIITRDPVVAARFQQVTDAACVYVNASTRFTDGSQFGFGAEIGISTQKLHARGPMGLRELNTYKYVVDGAGQIRV